MHPHAEELLAEESLCIEDYPVSLESHQYPQNRTLLSRKIDVLERLVSECSINTIIQHILNPVLSMNTEDASLEKPPVPTNHMNDF